VVELQFLSSTKPAAAIGEYAFWLSAERLRDFYEKMRKHTYFAGGI
jgi:hypothetical protein